MTPTAISEPPRPPDRAALETRVGTAIGNWDALSAAAEAMGARADWVWSGPKYGWSWKAKRAGKPFVSLEPHDGGFRALVVLGRDDSVRAGGLPLGPRMRATYDAARQYPDGRWVFHAVETDEDVRDVLALVRLKLPPTIRARFEPKA